MTKVSELPYETPEEKDAFDFIESRQGDSALETEEQKFQRLFNQDCLAKNGVPLFRTDGSLNVYAVVKRTERIKQQNEQ